MNNVGMGNMNAMAGPVGGPMSMGMNNGAMPAAQQMPQQPQTQTHRTMLNTYIYDYFIKEGLYDVARAMLSSEQAINVLQKDSPGRRENGVGNGDDPMDTDSKDDLNKRPDDLPAANIPISSDSCFLYEWFGLFWEMLNGHRLKPGGNNQVSSYIQHTQVGHLMASRRALKMIICLTPCIAAEPAEAKSATRDVASDAPGSDAVQPGHDAKHAEQHADRSEQEQSREDRHGQ